MYQKLLLHIRKDTFVSNTLNYYALLKFAIKNNIDIPFEFFFKDCVYYQNYNTYPLLKYENDFDNINQLIMYEAKECYFELYILFLYKKYKLDTSELISKQNETVIEKIYMNNTLKNLLLNYTIENKNIFYHDCDNEICNILKLDKYKLIKNKNTSILIKKNEIGVVFNKLVDKKYYDPIFFYIGNINGEKLKSTILTSIMKKIVDEKNKELLELMPKFDMLQLDFFKLHDYNDIDFFTKILKKSKSKICHRPYLNNMICEYIKNNEIKMVILLIKKVSITILNFISYACMYGTYECVKKIITYEYSVSKIFPGACLFYALKNKNEENKDKICKYLIKNFKNELIEYYQKDALLKENMEILNLLLNET